ncbi:hypothetical protein [Nitrosococcus halophilus]|uniref:hypothetical protein n=1 Tax=Nitrosococcus halophilus TaxID=133539 RepID=UPI0006749DC5|nr:hypothetical protein [Nitrosococcus halophilus]
MEDYQGKKYRVIHCEGARESFESALEHAPKHLQDSYRARMRRIREYLADGRRLSKETFPKEGKLPDGSHFWALKKIPIRAYVWLSTKSQRTFYISHYIYKKRDKLVKSDIKRVCDNWRKIEEGEDE